MRKAVLSLLLWTWTGTTYFFVEVVFKTLRGRPETISWTMLALAILLAIPLERFGAELPWDCPLWLQALICGTAITAAELAGLLLPSRQPLGTDLPAILGPLVPAVPAHDRYP